MPELYEILYTAEAVADIRGLRAYDRRRILSGIQTHLSIDPARVSRSRIKRMVQPNWSQYRLRIDEFRVYYDVEVDRRRVLILRVLRKGTHSTPGGF